MSLLPDHRGFHSETELLSPPLRTSSTTTEEGTEAIEKLLEEFGTEAQKSRIGNGLNASISGSSILKNCVETAFRLESKIAGTAASERYEAFF